MNNIRIPLPDSLLEQDAATGFPSKPFVGGTKELRWLEERLQQFKENLYKCTNNEILQGVKLVFEGLRHVFSKFKN